MWFENFITDKVNFYNENWEIIYENLWIQLNSNWIVNIWWIDKLFKKWYFFIRKVNDFVEEKYYIKKVDYQDHPRDKFFRITKLEAFKDWEENLISQPYISAWTYIQAWWDIIVWNNNKNITNEIDKFIELLNKNNIDKKDEIIKLLEEYRKTQDKNKIVDIFSILWNWASISSMIIALSTLIK